MASGPGLLNRSVQKATSFLMGKGRAHEPVGTVHVVDPSPLNWLHITYNTVEELVTSPTSQLRSVVGVCGRDATVADQ